MKYFLHGSLLSITVIFSSLYGMQISEICNEQNKDVIVFPTFIPDSESEKLYKIIPVSATSSLWSMHNSISTSALCNNSMRISTICNDQDEDLIDQIEKDETAITLSTIHNDSYSRIESLIATEASEFTDICRKIIPKKNKNVCPLCDSSFMKKYGIYAHAVRCHNACTTCNILFSSQVIITLHLIKRHSTKKGLIKNRILRMRDDVKETVKEIMNFNF